MPELLTRVSCRKDWKRTSVDSSLMSFQQPNGSRDLTEDINACVRMCVDVLCIVCCYMLHMMMLLCD